MLQINKLGAMRGERWLWQDLQFELPFGKLLQVSGANGSGKTSLLRVLAGLAPTQAGSVYWRGAPIEQQKTSYQQQLQYLGHQGAIKTELTVKENLRFSLPKTQEKSRLEAIEQVGLTTHMDQYGYQLSQGQKQRLALARVLLNSAPLWILDEPMAGLDADMNVQLQTIFAGHINRGGMIVLTAHHPLTLSALSADTRMLRLS